jgi:hypothetical protein
MNSRTEWLLALLSLIGMTVVNELYIYGLFSCF